MRINTENYKNLNLNRIVLRFFSYLISLSKEEDHEVLQYKLIPNLRKVWILLITGPNY